MDNVPAYVSVVFMLTTFVTAGIFLYGVRQIAPDSRAALIVLFLVPFWLIFQFFLARTGFYTDTASIPPRILLFGLAPSLILIIGLFAFARKSFVSRLPITVLSIVHIVRIPVELTLAWLADAGAVPDAMTFHGTNFDILSGITAPLAFYFARRNDSLERTGLLVWNIAALLLLFNIVITAVLCAPTPFQQFAFDQPNIAVLHSPFIWLPAIIVPIVFFSHLASIYKLLSSRSI